MLPGLSLEEMPRCWGDSMAPSVLAPMARDVESVASSLWSFYGQLSGGLCVAPRSELRGELMQKSLVGSSPATHLRFSITTANSIEQTSTNATLIKATFKVNTIGLCGINKATKGCMHKLTLYSHYQPPWPGATSAWTPAFGLPCWISAVARCTHNRLPVPAPCT